MEKYNLTPGIAIYDDRVEFLNPGTLPPQLTPETIKFPHLSYPYNPIIAEVLYKTTFLENWGSGTGRIIDACRKAGVAEPFWKNEGGFVIVTFPRLSGTQGGTQDDIQGGNQDNKSDTRDDTQDVNLDEWIECQLILRPKITTEELALLSGRGLRTILLINPPEGFQEQPHIPIPKKKARCSHCIGLFLSYNTLIALTLIRMT